MIPIFAFASIFLVQVIACDAVLEPSYVVGLCADGKTSQECGTGFTIDDHTIVTARHVVRDIDGNLKPNLYARATQYYEEELAVKVLRISEDYDIAIVHIEKHLDDTIPPCQTPLEIGDLVETHGFFGMSTIETYEGQISKFYETIIESTAESHPGFSGGPMINTARDCVVGVIYAHRNPAQYALSSPVSAAP